MTSIKPAHAGAFSIPAACCAKGAAEFCEDLLYGAGKVRVERIVSMQHASPEGFWYDQDEDEWCLVLDGEARLGFDDGTSLALGRGESVLLPAHVRHRVLATSAPCIWLCIFGQGLALPNATHAQAQA